ncbi:unknown protein [Seminavis robusta]|uniref:Uncharacterized protein n=1 Tax=Seminavis robusta TaxID=568900 RepID=A0A9N8H9H3_9STRA|nr:unknown protein [Seminavis robusta]|eukprot:Sro191_g082260.1 n/a (348) ;mRNA; f:53936-54979
MVKYSKSREGRVFGFGVTHIPTKKSESSKRTVAAANAMKVELGRPLSKNQKRRTHKKLKKLLSLPNPGWDGLITVDPAEFSGAQYSFAPEELLLVDAKDGFVHWLDRANGVFSCIVVPRKLRNVAMNGNNTEVVTAALERLQKIERSNKRGEGQTGESTCNAKYAIFGTKALQRKGLSRSKLQEKCPEEAKILEAWALRLEHLAANLTPSTQLRAIKKAAELVDLCTIEGCTFGGALASSVDYSAPAHVDDDFFLSAHQLNVSGRFGDEEIVQYFCFPSCGFAVALRPGDVILFNPQVHHCLSKKSPAYAEDRVHVTTMYLKTRLVGKNDTSATLTEEEKEYFVMKL